MLTMIVYFIVALLFSWVTISLARRYQFLSWPAFQKSDVYLNIVQVLGAFFIYFATIWLFAKILLTFLLKISPLDLKQDIAAQADAFRGWVNLVVMSLVFVFLAIYLKKLDIQTSKTVLGPRTFEKGFSKIKHFLSGMLTWVISFPLVLAVGQLTGLMILLFNLESRPQVAVAFLKSTMGNPVVFVITCVMIVLVIPTIEETLFRGFLQNYLAKIGGRVFAVIVNSLIFAGFHFSMSQGWGNLEIIPSLFTLSCFLGFIYFRQQSILASIGLHASFNAANIIMMMRW